MAVTGGGIRIASINARGCNSQKKRYALNAWIKENKIDILNIQETHIKKEKIKEFDESFEGTIFHNYSSTNHGKGVAIIIRKDLHIKILNHWTLGDGRAIIILFEKSERKYVLTNLYAPTERPVKKAFYEEVAKYIGSKKPR